MSNEARELRARIHEPSHFGERIADMVTAFVGSWLFIGLHVFWFTAWIVFRVEPFPFGLLTMIVSLEAIFLSTLVMISQNRQAVKDRKRDDHEAVTIDVMAEDHKLLMNINKQQTDLLNQHTEILKLLQGQEKPGDWVVNRILMDITSAIGRCKTIGEAQRLVWEIASKEEE